MDTIESLTSVRLSNYSSIPYFSYKINSFSNNHFELVINKFSGYSSFQDFDVIEKDKINQSYDFKLDNSVSRSRTNIFDISSSNDFEFFITLTLDKSKKDRFDLDSFIKDFSQFLRNERRRYKRNGFNSDLQYLLIPEKHSDGSWHMHGLINGIHCDDLFVNENGYLDWSRYKSRFGYVSISRVRNKIAVAKYITKYISKNLNDRKEDKGKKLYYCSRGLNRKETIEEGEILKSYINLDLTLNTEDYFENDFVIKREFKTKKEIEQFLKKLYSFK